MWHYDFKVATHYMDTCDLKESVEGSVKFKKGDKVQKAQIIAQIGNSGNSTEPHLHFQMNEGGDVLNVRSIPIRFYQY